MESGCNQVFEKLRLLVVIASYGEKNLSFLQEIIRDYQSLSLATEIVVVSETVRSLGERVKVIAGLPSNNPYSLPFAHKPVLAENLERFDLFVYSEDDIKVTEGNIRAFWDATQELDRDEVAGHLRYEVDSNGQRFLPDIHWGFHWRADSVRRRGRYTVAELTNQHSGFYILTQDQLRRAIHSGGFLCRPYEGVYGMLETAATDPYTRCGLKKVICISALNDFLIHHMSNRYAGKMGIPFDFGRDQVDTLLAIRDGRHPVSVLCDTEATVLPATCSKSYYEPCRPEVVALLPATATSVLTIGCGWGGMEQELIDRGLTVTSLPLDSVIGRMAAARGISVRYGRMEESLAAMRGQKFDAVVITNLLHLLPDPDMIISFSRQLLAAGGALVVAGPNFDYLPILTKSTLRRGQYALLSKRGRSGIRALSVGLVKRQLRNAGLTPSRITWFNLKPDRTKLSELPVKSGRFVSTHWVVAGTDRQDMGHARALTNAPIAIGTK